MIDIRINRSDDHCTIVIEGHANYAPTGQDIVCAAISSQYINLVNSIDMLTEAKAEEYPTKNSKMICIDSLDDKARLLIDSFRLACVTISEDYPNNVKVKVI